MLQSLKVKPIPQKQVSINININNEDTIDGNVVINDQIKNKRINKEEFMKKLLLNKQLQVLSKENEVTVDKLKNEEASKIMKTNDRMTIKRKKINMSVTDTKKSAVKKISSIEDKENIYLDRLPKPQDVTIQNSKYYSNNREVFSGFINTLLHKYRDDILNKETKNKDNKKFGLMTHQEIVRDYINLYTPYRGLLLYHGLGSGKTCSSIAIAENIITTSSIAMAEGMMTNKEIIVMTPASLQKNYIEELKKCGNPIYKKNQYWEFINYNENPESLDSLSKTLNISTSYIQNENGAWMVNAKKESNYDSLTPDEKTSLDKQLDVMIDSKFSFINYNGIRKKKINEMTHQNTVNPFDNKVIIIDEAHNFVSRIVNKIKREKPDNKNYQPTEVSTIFYKNLMEAEDTRIILLTGTPMINYPNEISILFNLLRGYIKTWHMKLESTTGNQVSEKKVISILKNNKILDYMSFNSNILTITRNPFGFININDPNYNGIKLSNDGNTNDKNFLKLITKLLKDNGIKIVPKTLKLELNKALPDKLETFNDLFINDSNGELKNEDVFKRRIIGLTSYFKSAQESLMPKYDSETDLYVEHIDMSDFQFGKYEEARKEERKTESSRKKKKNKIDEIYDESSSTYRIFSRAFCNFVFPDPPGRPMPKDGSEINVNTQNINDEDDIDGLSIEERSNNIDGRISLDDVDNVDNNENPLNDSYQRRIIRALELLKINEHLYLSKEGLETFSPKFLKMLLNIENDDNKGKHLIYSQFRTLEGIGIFKLVLEANGFNEFKIKKKGNDWEIDLPDGVQFTPNKTFALYTGTESTEEKEIIRNIYNGDWEYLSSNLALQLRGINENNNMGEIIKLFMITASGAEGISLKNTRFVHIIEPYWHPVRMEQVIGRARRILSHQDLEPELRTVKVFLYLMKLTPDQIKNGSNELRKKDKSKYNMGNLDPVTTDESLYEISRKKEDISKQLLTAIKETAMDCSIYSRSDGESLQCYSFRNETDPTVYGYKPNIKDEEKDRKVQKQNIKSEIWKAKRIEIDGKNYALKIDEFGKRTNLIYDIDSYKQARNNPNINIIFVGKLIKDESGNDILDTNV